MHHLFLHFIMYHFLIKIHEIKLAFNKLKFFSIFMINRKREEKKIPFCLLKLSIYLHIEKLLHI